MTGDWKIRSQWVRHLAAVVLGTKGILFTFLARGETERVFMATIQGEAPNVFWTACPANAGNLEQAAAQKAVLELACAELGKRRTPAHRDFFRRLALPLALVEMVKP